MTRKPVFWLLLALGSALCLGFSVVFFTKSFPTMERSINMSRSSAEQTALTRAKALQLAPTADRHAVRFFHDDDTQNFIELEAGGSRAVNQLTQQNIYQVYQWEVRLFREHDPAHTTLYFTPNGQTYGFVRVIPEQQAGPALSAASARQLAETRALQDWQIDLSPDLSPAHSPFRLAEQSFLTRPNGRVDHTFVYERNDQRLGAKGEGRVRLRLQVTGDQFSQLRYSLKIPESFSRRYESMRTSNNTIAGVASFAMLALYGVGGCLIGLAILWRQGRVLVRPALFWASVIALLQFADALNAIPGSWFQYDNALSAQDFLIQRVSQAIFSSVFNWLILALSLMAAESLSRKAFGDLAQFWQLWRAADSKQVLGQTMGGYLWVGYDLAFIVGFYYLSQHYWGWWSPAESLIDPDILATPLPWLTPVARALHAGFWEECLFRAVPLAGAALLGDFLQQQFHGRFGGRKTWLLIGLVAQALIFGAAHANYAQQPAYARPLELFLPSLIWGLVYLRFGLLPGIIFHFIFDLSLMSLPLFATQADGLAVSRAIVIAIGALPLLRVMWARWRAGKWEELPATLRNHAWQIITPAASASQTHPAKGHQHHATASVWLRRILPVLGCVGVLAWYAFPPKSAQTLPFSMKRNQAEQVAAQALAERGVKLNANWRHFSIIRPDLSRGHEYIWQNAGVAAYNRLQGRYLPPVVWQVRYIQFVDDVVQRAEEWVVNVEQGVDAQGGAPHVRGIVHVLPESRAGASLSVQQARNLVLPALQQRLGASATQLRELSAQETKLPQRRDWLFSFADDQASMLKKGEARIEVHLAGDEVASVRRAIHIPEEWERQQRAQAAPMQPLRIGLVLALVLLGAGSCIMSIKLSSGKVRSDSSVWVATIGLFVLTALGQANHWQSIASQLRTEQPLTLQLGTMLAGLLLVTTLTAVLGGVMLSLARQVAAQDNLGPDLNGWRAWLAGAALAAAIVGAKTVVSSLCPGNAPLPLALHGLDAVIPTFSAFASGVTDVLIKGNLLLLGLSQLQQFNHHFTRRQVPTICILLLVGLGLAMGAPDIAQFLIKGGGYGLGLALVYLLVARFEPKLLFMALFYMLVLERLQQAWVAPWPGAWGDAMLHAVVLLISASWWFGFLRKNAVRQ